MNGLSNPSQLLLRNRDAIDAGSLLLINPPGDGVYAHLADATALSLDFGEHRRLAVQGNNARFGLTLPPDRSFAQVVLFLTKAKARTRMLLDFAGSFGAPGGRIWLIGEKRAGIGSAARLLRDAYGASTKLDAARHCMLFESPVGDGPRARFTLETYWQIGQWTLADETLPIASLPGVFSHGEPDPGTAMLLDAVAFEGHPALLDFGSGCGVIAAHAARRGARVSALDCDWLALESTRRTLALNGTEAATVIAGDRLARIDGRFDLIVSNPPFHRGTRTATAAAHALIREAPAHLNPGGRLLLVANAFLDYPRVLDAAFGGHRVLAADRRYRVYEARAR